MTREEATALLLLALPGTGELTQPPQVRPSGAAPEGLGTARFTKPLELKKRRSARCPRVRRWCSSTPKTTAPASGQLAAHIALGVTWGGLVGDRGHRKGQLRVLGSPSARRTKEPMAGGGGRGLGVRGPDFFGERPLIHI
jgi:hypothetical protein